MITKPKKKKIPIRSLITKPRKKKVLKRNPSDDDIVHIYSISLTKLGKLKGKIDYFLVKMFQSGIIDILIRSYENGKWITFYTQPPLTGNQAHAYEKIITGLIELEGIENTG